MHFKVYACFTPNLKLIFNEYFIYGFNYTCKENNNIHKKLRPNNFSHRLITKAFRGINTSMTKSYFYNICGFSCGYENGKYVVRSVGDYDEINLPLSYFKHNFYPNSLLGNNAASKLTTDDYDLLCHHIGRNISYSTNVEVIPIVAKTTKRTKNMTDKITNALSNYEVFQVIAKCLGNKEDVNFNGSKINKVCLEITTTDSELFVETENTRFSFTHNDLDKIKVSRNLFG